MSEPCRHEREFAGTQADTLTSFVKTSGELVKVTAERDALRAALARVRALHTILLKGIRFVTLDDIRAALEPTDQPKGTK